MKEFSAEREQLGTLMTIKVVGFDEGRIKAAMERAFEESGRIEAAYSRFISGNDLADLNSKLGEWVELDEELYELIAFGVRVGEVTDGAFDMSVKSVLEGWGYDSSYSLKEGEAGSVGSVELDDGKVRLSAEIELGGLGKGYVLDRMMAVMEGFANVCIDAGGDVFVRGSNVNGDPWRIAFEHPENLEEAIGFVDASGLALGCSSPARRKWRDRHHIVDPALGEPAANMLAVYTQADVGILADAYSTALFALGFEKARALVGGLPVEAMLVGKDGAVWRSEGFKGALFEV